ncbi:MAG: gamma-D-glutamyl-L-lysine dipeptidyl-peptidase, partial [Actinomycetota bacterium]|nr:gamma-D-glutamyl-L-lysine dipeptidyl-peptidase [Actinomycetota bacterium]
MSRLRLVAAVLLTLVACGSGDTPGRAGRQPVKPAEPAEPAPAVPEATLVDVAVANLWAEPDQARPLDAPSLTNPVDTNAWRAAMTVDDRRWLVDRLVTQALYGDEVKVLETAGGWSRVVVLRQPSHLDPRGYPGWLPTAQLASVPRPPDTGTQAVVTRPSATLRAVDPAGATLEVSFNTRLPVVRIDNEHGVTVAGPDGQGWLRPADVAVLTPTTPSPTGEDVVRRAQLFSGVEYLWAGTSGAGWDCSGFTHAAYA